MSRARLGEEERISVSAGGLGLRRRMWGGVKGLPRLQLGPGALSFQWLHIDRGWAERWCKGR